jgi:hypothetical protein
VVGVAEIGAIAGGPVSVPRAQLAVPGGQRTIRSCFLAPLPHVSGPLALLGLPVSLLGAQITLLRTFDEDRDAGIGLDEIQLSQDRVPVALTLVGFLVAPISSAISLMGLAVTSIGFAVTSIGFAVTSIGFAVTSIGLPVTQFGSQVLLPAGTADRSGVVAHARSPVACIAGLLSLRRGMVTQIRSPLAPLCGPLTFLRRQRAVQPRLQFLPGEGAPHVVRPLCGDRVTLLGSAPALALLGLGSHRASLP